jgi:glycosyltransferase involved in cell wall biosynthesis
VSTATKTADSTPLEQEIASRRVEERAPAREFFSEYAAGDGAPIAVVIPAFNEEPTIAAVVRGIPKTICGLEAEVIVVVDGSADKTAEEARSAGALVCDMPVNRGQGLTLRLSYWLADKRGAKIIATTDADGQYDEGELSRVVQPILDGNADFVNGSRRLGTELTTDSTRHLGVVVFGQILSVLLGQKITDPAAGVRAFRVEVPRAVRLDQPQYQSSEMLIATGMNGFHIVEVATTMRDRPEGATLTKKGPNLIYGLRFSQAIMKTYIRERKAGRRSRHGDVDGWRERYTTS